MKEVQTSCYSKPTLRVDKSQQGGTFLETLCTGPLSLGSADILQSKCWARIQGLSLLPLGSLKGLLWLGTLFSVLRVQERSLHKIPHLRTKNTAGPQLLLTHRHTCHWATSFPGRPQDFPLKGQNHTVWKGSCLASCPTLLSTPADST